MAITWISSGERVHEGRVLDAKVWHAHVGGDYEGYYATIILPGGITHDVRIGTVSYASSWPAAHADADATPEAIAEMERWEAHRGAIFAEEKAATTVVNAFHRFDKGVRVRFVKGRKVKKGTVAEVAWFGQRFDEWRVGIRVNGEMVFAAADNCVREFGDEDKAALERAWGRWINARIAYEDLIETEHNARGDFDPKQYEHRWYAYQKAVARWAKDWPTIDHDHRDAVCDAIERGRTVRHTPNRQESEPIMAAIV